jgi:hypothetical protein
MNNKSSKKHMMRDISKFGSTKCFCDDGNLFQGLKTSFMRQIFGSCSVCFINIDQCLPNAMQKMYPNEDLSGVRLFLLPPASSSPTSKQAKEKRQNKKMLAEEAGGESRYLVQLCTVVDFQVGKEEFGWHKIQVLQGLAKSNTY